MWGEFRSKVFPSPIQVLVAMKNYSLDSSFHDDLIQSLFVTIQAMLISIIIAATISYTYTIPLLRPISVFVSKCRFLTLTGLIYVFTMIASNTHELKIMLLLFGIIPFFVTSLVGSMLRGNEQLYELCTTIRMNKWETLLEVVVIGKLDSLIVTIQQNFAIAWMMITLVESKAMNEGGIGTLLIKSDKHIDMSNVFALLVFVFIIGVTSDIIMSKMTKWFFPYRR
jgi:NitT/TauT family transport system permease protein